MLENKVPNSRVALDSKVDRFLIYTNHKREDFFLDPIVDYMFVNIL